MKKQKDDFKQAISDLKNLIFMGRLDQVDDWVGIYNIKNDKDRQKRLVLEIINDGYFFSFSSANTDLNRYLVEKEKRVWSVMSNLSFKNQWSLLSNIYAIGDERDITVSFLKKLSTEVWNKIDKEDINNICFVAYCLFAKEKFEHLQELINKFGTQLLETGFPMAPLFYKHGNSTGCVFLVLLGEDKNKVVNDVIFNDTGSKRDFLSKLGLSVPDLDECDRFRSAILNGAAKSKNGYLLDDDLPTGGENQISISNLMKRFEVYRSSILMERLQSNLQEDKLAKENKKSKI